MQQNRALSKSFHAGRAASNGILAALMAYSDYDSSDEDKGAKAFQKYSVTQNYDVLTDSFGENDDEEEEATSGIVCTH